MGWEFASREPQQEQARDTLPVLIVTTNEVPGCRITPEPFLMGTGRPGQAQPSYIADQ